MKDFKKKITDALERIGRTNGQQPPVSQDPIDQVIHEYRVATLAESYFKKRREIAKATLSDAVGENNTRLQEAVDKVRTSELGTAVTLAQGQYYGLTAQIKNGATFLNTSKLKVELLKKMDTDAVARLWQKCTERRNPSVTFVATEGDENDDA